jgi:hypothetical protein
VGRLQFSSPCGLPGYQETGSLDRPKKGAATSTAELPFAFLWRNSPPLAQLPAFGATARLWRNSPATVANVTQFLTAEILL